MSNFHTPVLLKETLGYLNIQPGDWYVDCNLGGGGHTEEILKKGGKVIGIDLDPDSINFVAQKYKPTPKRLDDRTLVCNQNLILVHDNFSNLPKIVQDLRINFNQNIKISGILFDLGVSSFQLDQQNRGFSFSKDAPLDMRMNPNSQTVTAADLVNGLYQGELTELFRNWGEERNAGKIAKKIVEYRKTSPIKTTKQLADLTGSIIHSKEKIHPATRVFQALRIAVNDELNNLEKTLPQAFDLLKPDGRLVVISFHSLEDRIAKNFFRKIEEKETGKILTKKPIGPTEEEIQQNSRSHSAKLRALQKLSNKL